jgi:hypothetical protein
MNLETSVTKILYLVGCDRIFILFCAQNKIGLHMAEDYVSLI